MLGTAFLASNDGKIATTCHVAGRSDSNLVVLRPHVSNMNQWQDLTDTNCQPIHVRLIEVDPVRDLAILKAEIFYSGVLPALGSFDNLSVGDALDIYGFPHCVDGRRALTFQSAELGAKVLMASGGTKSKHAVVNIQARPGQSGSPIYSKQTKQIAGMLIGAWAGGGSVSINGMNIAAMHQTTHCISAEGLREMIA